MVVYLLVLSVKIGAMRTSRIKSNVGKWNRRATHGVETEELPMGAEVITNGATDNISAGI
jgi:hypothetical protein